MSGTAGGRRAVGDAGSATVLAAAAVGVLVCLLGLGLQLGAATLARHRAETAADLAALAGAREAVRGADVACARAREVAAGNGADVADCAVEGWTVTVITTYPCRCLPSVSGEATGRARAGPVAVGGPPSGRARVTGGDREVNTPGRAEGGPG
ncbi:secretion/DNA translocation related TadE-like protein [Actinomycetospora succinea]|uniref:Secretion/DNA translocation related TadE-like protein n=1 Tax=Actinomycetospora succinea TaxID=663603 RepID=A0A4R6VGZ8_9PSEU|nr:Rv3654c family TadE-like protein [Actinomycetospora succinea]TDQ60576.1 secretion/DNA translocation related TadE-like protein [Actinomycetospora succinea]